MKTRSISTIKDTVTIPTLQVQDNVTSNQTEAVKQVVKDTESTVASAQRSASITNALLQVVKDTSTLPTPIEFHKVDSLPVPNDDLIGHCYYCDGKISIWTENGWSIIEIFSLCSENLSLFFYRYNVRSYKEQLLQIPLFSISKTLLFMLLHILPYTVML